jgi:DNA helicase-2/ATP-dependent DNA helicase PcrA
MQQFNVPFTHGEFRPEPGIQIMTAHQSKGLEYDVVLIPELIDGSWGNKRQMEKLSLPASITGKKITKDTLNEEERRLFFVAITRAKKELWISFPESLNNKAVVMSEFLPDLENQIIQNALIAQPELLLVTRDSTLFGITFQEEEKKFLEVLLREYRL